MINGHTNPKALLSERIAEKHESQKQRRDQQAEVNRLFPILLQAVKDAALIDHNRRPLAALRSITK